MKSKLIQFLYAKDVLYIFGFLLAAGISLQLYYAPKKDYNTGQEIYTKYNNYLIFKDSYGHLKEGKPLYQIYPNEYWDLYKYTPTFSLLMAPFYALPDLLGLFLWNLLNISVLIWALVQLPLKNKKMYLWIFGFTLLELITSTQNTQSNALIAGLIIAGYNLIESKKMNYAIALLSVAVMIKPFAIFGFIPLIFHSNLFQNIGKSMMVLLFLILLPLILVSPEELVIQYSSWIDLLAEDHGDKVGFSVMGWLKTWFGFNANKLVLLIVGLLTLLIPLLKSRYYQSNFYKLNYLALILIWIVIFNHMAESPTFVIATTGVAIWFFNSAKSILDFVLLGLVLIFTILISTDLFPSSLREKILEPYALKGVPCILVYLKILYDIFKYESKKRLLSNAISA